MANADDDEKAEEEEEACQSGVCKARKARIGFDLARGHANAAHTIVELEDDAAQPLDPTLGIDSDIELEVKVISIRRSAPQGESGQGKIR